MRSHRTAAFSVVVLTVLLVALSTTGMAAAKKPVKADVVYHHGKIYTVNKKFQRVPAMAIKGDRFLAVGSNKQMRKHIGSRTTVINLKGKVVIPGLIENHIHYSGIGSAKQQIDAFWKPKQEILDLVAAAAAAAQPGEWIQGRGWNQEVWTPAVFPTAAELDAVAPNNPVVLTRTDGHALWANSKAMELAGITDTTPNPAGGEIVRDPVTGRATGVFVDNAMALIRSVIPPDTERQQLEALQLAQDELLQYGITTGVDQGSFKGTIELMKRLYASGELKVRVQQHIRVNSAEDLAAAQEYFTQPKKQRIGLYGNRYTINGIKTSVDGALGSRGAWMLEDYSDRPDWRGLVRVTPEDLYTYAKDARQHGFQVAVHAIGDAANRAALDVFERINGELPKLSEDPRWRVEHAQVVALSDIPRFAEVRAIPSMQSVHATSDKNMAEERVGPERIKGAYAWRKFLNTGVVLPNGSDAPVELLNPYHGLYAAVTRMDREGTPAGGWYPEERMTREEALKSFTIWGAYATFTDRLKGSIEKHKLADFVIVDKDPMRVPAAQLKDMAANMTVLGGEVVYTAPGFNMLK
jgi:predicted amidohydrolase YtcJ